MKIESDPRDWDECTLMTNFINDNPKISMEMMVYQNLMIQLYDSGR